MSLATEVLLVQSIQSQQLQMNTLKPSLNELTFAQTFLQYVASNLLQYYNIANHANIVQVCIIEWGNSAG